MTNREVARTFNKLAKVMELHGENAFKIRSYSSAYNTIRRLPDEVYGMPRERLIGLPGVGKNIADKIVELQTTGKISTLEGYLDKTPPGIVELLGIKGLGAKKILTVWNDLGVETPGELLYACEENRLVDLKGFGQKTQSNLRDQLVYYLDAQGKYLYGHVLEEAEDLIALLTEAFPDSAFSFVNDIKRQQPIVHCIEIIGTEDEEEITDWLPKLNGYAVVDGQSTYMGSQIRYEMVDPEDFEATVFQLSASDDFLEEWGVQFDEVPMSDDASMFEEAGIEYIPPESRELPMAISRAKDYELDLVSMESIKGVVHAHSTYSDGANTLADMAKASKEQGYQYLVISDHSKSAFYANGLKEDAVHNQMEEIDGLNARNPSFRIFKGIESDILYDGQLDYEDEVLALFDVVIASVHAHLKMDVVKATDRVITAVNNKYTRILGHPTGRLLLSRQGYPLDHEAVIDACADNNVIIELNANPYRLDLDWTWIPYAIERGVRISINPDAHSIKGITDIRYGVSAARKALVRPMDCINAMSLDDFSLWVKNK